MVSSAATTVSQYLSALPPPRRAEISRVRDLVNANLPSGYEEGIIYGMISWFIPLAKKPDTYNGQPLCIASLGAQKNYNALYLMTVYGDPTLEKKFRGAFKAAGKKLDMGKSCVRFSAADELVPSAIEDAIKAMSVDDYIAHYDKVRGNTKTAKKAAAKTTAKAKAKPAAKAKPTATKKPAAKRKR